MTAPTHTIRIRVRYGETDQGGVVYHSHYLVYFETGRTEFLRERGARYRDVEGDGLILTVVEAELRFLRPARYDDLLRIETRVLEVGGARIAFGYEVYRDDSDELLCTGSTRLGSLSAETGRPCRLPPPLRALLGS